MIRTFKLLFLCIGLASVTLTTGCAQLTLNPPKSSIENVQKARNANIRPASVGAFRVDPKKDASIDKELSLRGANTVASPVGGSFAQYLKETLAAELQSAGLLDPQSTYVIAGVLTESSVETVGTGKGTLAARFTVTQGGAVKYEKELRASSTWESSFMAAVAVPAAAGAYEGLYKTLIGQLLDDADFKKALAK